MESAYRCKPLIMGVLNVTPDSFSDGGQFLDCNHAVAHANRLIVQGVDIIDIGGESSKPGAQCVSIDEELSRVIPVIERIRAISDICISIDTYKADVMKAAVAAGANIINDIKALTGEGALSVAAMLDVPICLMHMHGEPLFMQNKPTYIRNVVDEIDSFFHERIETCSAAGIPRHRLILDPGFGFGKTVQHNLMLVNALSMFKQHELPVMLGVSRKSTIGAITNKAIAERLSGGLALAVFAALQGVTIIRTHDVNETKQALDLIDAVMYYDKFKEQES